MATTAGTTEALVKTTCNLPNLGTGVITPHLPTAEIRARAYIGDTVYAALVAAAGAPYTSAAKDQLKLAEAFFAGSIALGLSNLSTEGTGVFGAVAGLDQPVPMIGEERLKAMMGRYEALAYEALAPYWVLNRDAIRDSADELDGLPDPQSIRAGRIVMRASS